MNKRFMICVLVLSLIMALPPLTCCTGNNKTNNTSNNHKLLINGTESSIEDFSVEKGGVSLPLYKVLRALGAEFDSESIYNTNDSVALMLENVPIVIDYKHRVFMTESAYSAFEVSNWSARELNLLRRTDATAAEQSDYYEMYWVDAEVYVDSNTLQAALSSINITIVIDVDYNNESVSIIQNHK